MNIQNQIRENVDDHQNFLLDLNNWEKEMHKKEEEMQLAEVTADQEFPPIRNSLSRSKKKSRHKKSKDKNVLPSEKRIPSDDYQAWNKFDVDKEIEKIDLDGYEEKKQSASENSEDEEEMCLKKRKQLAVLNKDKGNEYFKKGSYDSAINNYTAGMQLDPENPLLAANRAMAFLKKEQYQAAENDCTLCLSIDPTYVKAYLRRGTARIKLEKFSLAREDFSKALELEPDNKQAQSELAKTKQNIDASQTNVNQESEVVKSQEFWPKFLGNKTIEHPGDNPLSDQISASTSHDLECIFPDAKLLIPVQNSPDIDEECLTEIPISNLDETDFANQIKLLKPTVTEEKNKVCNSEISNIVDLPEPTLPPVPTAAYQFFTDWKTISSYPNLKYQYLKQFPPEKLKVIFRHSMEPEIFPEILHTLATQFLGNMDDVFHFMKCLSEIGRFSTMLMFLTSLEQKDLNSLIDAVKNSDRSNEEKEQLINLYKI